MNIQANHQTPYFKGYKNVIYNDVKNKSEFGFKYIAMQLDNYGKKDLDTWYTIQKKFLNRKTPKDTVTFSVFKFNNKNHFILSNYLLNIPPEKEGTELERIMLKAFTLIASLTKEIKCNMPVVFDKGLSETLLQAREDLLEIFGNKSDIANNPASAKDLDFVNKLMTSGIEISPNPKPVAKSINKEIQTEMEQYFNV